MTFLWSREQEGEMTDNHVPYQPGMTLMPGQSTSISVPIPAEAAKAMQSGRFSFAQVSPPAKAPVHDIAETLGVCDGLRAERSRSGQWRCSCCGGMQKGETWQVWVPDSVRRGDPAWSVTEAVRRNAYNGHLSAWCLPCAPKSDKKAAEWLDPVLFGLLLGFGIGTVAGGISALVITVLAH